MALGAVESAWAIGGVVGGLLMSAWGGPKRRIRGMLLGWMVFTLFGQVLFGLGRGLALWIPAVAIAAMSFPVSQGCSNAIWQANVEDLLPDHEQSQAASESRLPVAGQPQGASEALAPSP